MVRSKRVALSVTAGVLGLLAVGGGVAVAGTAGGGITGPGDADDPDR